jgi:glutamate carboxypeptidase
MWMTAATAAAEKALLHLGPETLPEMESLLRELVEISSHSDDAAGVNRVNERLAEYLARACEGELALERHPGRKYGDIFAWSTSMARRAERPAVVLIGHADTVFPAGTFEGGYRRDGALARGPGVLDMKGGLVAAAFALGALHRSGELAAIPARLVVVADEEVGSRESQPHLRQLCTGAEAALVLESGRKGDAIITRRKGTGAVTAIGHGKGAHAGNNHEQGRNAIWALARFIDRAQALTDYPKGITVSVGKIAGGVGKNTVPDRAEAQFDFRYITPADGEALVARLHELANQVGVELEGTRVELLGGIARPPLYRDDGVARLAAEVAQHQAAEGLGTAESPLVGGGSDASTAQAVGCPAVDGLGPRGIGFHTVDEQIEVATLVPKARSLLRFLAARRA